MPPRMLTGALYFGGWILFAWLGGWPLTIVVAGLSVLAVHELKFVAGRRRMRLAPEVAFAVAVAFVFAAHSFADDLENYGLALMVLIVLLVLVDFAVHLRSGLRAPTACVSLTAFGAIYCGLLPSALVLVRGYKPDLVAATPYFGKLPLGERLMFFLLIVTMVSDVGAMVAGKLFGKRKLEGTVSPNKTIEGCVGAVVGAVLAALLAGALFNVSVTPAAGVPPEYAWRASLAHRVVLGVLLGVFGQIGDFGASIFKREAEVKDYGDLFPGHGGVLDRLDTLIVNAPLVFLYAQLVM